ncbi:hypothetical protein [Flammeovirga kamogawensis]|uniref:Chromosome partition protein Smc n=1 Tax=Flammeovirga kamogawensis TaxID=373891 RepID=A0ABX8H4E6_9BACT|nr:hypothetical protein [Flammeovirga kamogawensis]MBB6461764.1 myosin heavy subunit [Flammeovirga kamogawensis]QWG10680.1 hypothetical protein KM029_25185 [Flammeovirga kamogawensis]TRX63783.1 hypothetical protein EO216_25560 [Flammeovirga kamogawensis]
MKNKFIVIGICLSTLFVGCKKDKEVVTEIQEVVVKDKSTSDENKVLKAKLDAISKKEDELKKRVDLLSDQSSQLESKNQQLVDDASKQQQKSGKATTDLNNKIKQLEVEKNNLENENKKLANKINNNTSNSTTVNNNLLKKVNDLENHKSASDKTINALTTRINNADALIKQLEQENDQSQISNTDLKIIIGNLQQQTKELNDDVEANINKLNATQQKLTTSESRLNSSKANNSELLKEKGILQKTINDQTIQVNKLSKQVNLLEAKIKKMEQDQRIEKIELAKKILPLFKGKAFKELPLNHKIVGHNEWLLIDFKLQKDSKNEVTDIILLLVKDGMRYKVSFLSGNEKTQSSFFILRLDPLSHIVNGVRMIKDEYKPFNKLNSNGIVVKRDDYADNTKFSNIAPFRISGLDRTILVDGKGKIYNKVTDKWEKGKLPKSIKGKAAYFYFNGKTFEHSKDEHEFDLDLDDYLFGTGNGKVAQPKPANYPKEDDIIGYNTSIKGVKTPIYLRDIKPENRATSDNEFLKIDGGYAIFGYNVMQLVKP